jgi:hypothetical protein
MDGVITDILYLAMAMMSLGRAIVYLARAITYLGRFGFW